MTIRAFMSEEAVAAHDALRGGPWPWERRLGRVPASWTLDRSDENPWKNWNALWEHWRRKGLVE